MGNDSGNDNYPGGGLKHSDGSYKHTNKLVTCESAYLQQHAHNPVDWYPWGKEAFHKAKKENKPILVSIGYSTCHWCHVMEREVFRDETIGVLLNERFVCVKIDREERPDLDDIFMTARQIITHDGGWPNHVFLTPDLKPFYAGGTFLNDQRFGMDNFDEIIDTIHESWVSKQEYVENAADQIFQGVVFNLSAEQGDSPDKKMIFSYPIKQLVIQLLEVHDAQHGGFFQAPKFPHENYLLYLLRYYKKTEILGIKNTIISSLDHMYRGGIYDHIAGGFHRYATDVRWHTPHFEKMLYTQALLIRSYTAASKYFDNKLYKDIVKKTLSFCDDTLFNKKGAYCAAVDAENDTKEGGYYVWSEHELNEHLTKQELDFFLDHYSLTAPTGGNDIPGAIITIKNPLAFSEGIPNKITKILNKLNTVRKKRHIPMVDDKIIAGWNGLMVSALVRASTVFKLKTALTRSLSVAEFLMKHLSDKEGALSRHYCLSKQKAYGEAFIEDYAYVIEGLLSIYQATDDKKWLNHAIKHMNKAIELFWDQESGAFFSTTQEQMDNHTALIRIKVGSDGALPSENAVMFHNLNELSRYCDQQHYADKALQIVSNFYHEMIHAPLNYAHLIHGLLQYYHVEVSDILPQKNSLLSDIANDNAPASKDHVGFGVEVLDEHNIELNKMFTVRVILSIDDRWHINTNPASYDFLIPTSLDFKGVEHLNVVALRYPEATTSFEESNGSCIQVYHNRIEIEADLIITKKAKKAKADHVDLEVCVSYQACRVGKCLPMSSESLVKSITIS